jgi:transposase
MAASQMADNERTALAGIHILQTQRDSILYAAQECPLRPAGVPARKAMIFEFMDDTQSWLQVYHMRSISESVNSVDKRRFPWILKKKLPWRKANESFLRRNIYNIRQYHNLMYLQPSLIEKLSE